MSSIIDIVGREVLDSRGNPTVEVEVVLEGEHHVFANGEQAVLAMTGKYLIKSVAAKESRLVVELQKDILVPNDLKEDWVRSYEKESGEDISFF